MVFMEITTKLDEKTNLIKHYCKAVKGNFLKIGELLIEVRNNELFKEKYETFVEYLDSQDFEFSKSYAYKIMNVYEEFSTILDSLPITKLIELTYVKDKVKREELLERAGDMPTAALKEEVKKLSKEELFNRIHRQYQREDEEVFTSDDAYLKCERIGKEILSDLDGIKKPIFEINERIGKWIVFTRKFSNPDIDEIKSIILKKKSEIMQ